MDEKIIDISESAAGLSVRNGQLVIRTEQGEFTTPLEEVAGLVVSHPAAHYTHTALAGVCASGGTVVLCNEKRLPVGMLLPLTQNYVLTERIAVQVQVSVPRRKQLWKEVVAAKVRSQAHLLVRLTGEDSGLNRLAGTVKSGDSSNIEAQAARRYWPALFGERFRRIPGGTDPLNAALNYGYAVLRGIVARAACGAGLFPPLGLHHHNRYNPFSLIDDLMEPYRPLVDREVVRIRIRLGDLFEIDRDVKAGLIGPLMSRRHSLKGDRRSLFDLAARTATSLLKAYGNTRGRVEYPELSFEEEQKEDETA